MKKRIFVDGMDNISLNNGLIRMNFSNETGKDSEVENTNELIMPPGAFLKAFGAMEDLVNKLIADGVISRNGKNEAAKAPAVADNKNNSESNSPSPNFG